MDGIMEPPPPGIIPNFPPKYPFNWQQIMPVPDPNHLQSMGLPTSFSNYSRPNPGHGSHDYCHEYDGRSHQGSNNSFYSGISNGGFEEAWEYYDERARCNYEEHGKWPRNVNVKANCHLGSSEHSDEYAAYEDDEEWQVNNDFEYSDCNMPSSCNNPYGAPAPAPKTKDHYYNLAPTAQCTSFGIGSRGRGTSTSKKNYLRRRYGGRFCDECEVGFYTSEEYSWHLKNHVKCPYPGCNVEAVIESLDRHITNLHLLHPSASRQINAEEYVKQRRNNFPSVQRAKLKQALVKLQKDRGELLGVEESHGRPVKGDINLDEEEADENDPTHVDSKEYEPLDTNKTRYKQQKSHKRKNWNDHKIARKGSQSFITVGVPRKIYEDTFILVTRVPAFCGIDAYRETINADPDASSIEQDAGNTEAHLAFEISDDEEYSIATSDSCGRDQRSVNASSDVIDVEGNSVRSASEPVVSGALGLLIGDYGSESDECDQGEETSAELNVGATLPSCSVGTVERSRDDLGKRTNMEADINSVSVCCDREVSSDSECDSPSGESAMDLTSPGKATVNSAKKVRRGRRGKKRKKRTAKEPHQAKLKCTETDKDVPPSVSATEVSRASDVLSSTSRVEVTCASDVFKLGCGLKPINRKDVSLDLGDSDTENGTRPLPYIAKEQKFATICIAKKYRRFRSKYRQSLLSKLLADEVTRERNILLQCAKYIVEADFFEEAKGAHSMRVAIEDGEVNEEDIPAFISLSGQEKIRDQATNGDQQEQLISREETECLHSVTSVEHHDTSNK